MKQTWTCPMCGAAVSDEYFLCPGCGFDRSTDYTVYPTLCPAKKIPVRDGFVRQKNTDGSVIEGEKKHGVFLGPFRKTYPNGAYFEGTYVDAGAEGALKYVDEKGNVTESTWHGGAWNGAFTKRLTDGTVHHGTYEDGRITGEVKCRYPDGGVLSCRWTDGAFTGQGTYTAPDGSILTGVWVGGELRGEGKLRYPDGLYYQGKIENLRPGGFGKFRMKNGTTAEGNFRGERSTEDVRVCFPNGAEYHGAWNRGLSGTGSFSYRTAKPFYEVLCSGRWEQDAPAGQASSVMVHTKKDAGAQYRGSLSGFQMDGPGSLYLIGGGKKELLAQGIWENGHLKSQVTSLAIHRAEAAIEKGLAVIRESIQSER